MNKSCSRCQEELPFEKFGRQAGHSDGLTSACKACLATAKTEEYAANPEKFIVRVRQFREANPMSIRAYMETHREQRAAATAAWRAANPEKAAAHLASWGANDPGRGERWRKANLDMDRAKSLRRRARRCGATGNGLTPSEWNEMKSYFGGRCAYCLTPCVGLEQEHMTPLYRGGSHASDNIVPACRSCNASKGTKNLLEFLSREVRPTLKGKRYA